MAEKRSDFTLVKNPLFMFIADAILLNGSILLTFSLRFSFSVPQRNIDAYHNTWPYITLVFILLFYIQGLYDFDENDDGLSVFFKVFTSVGLGTISIVALTFVSRDFAFPRTVFILAWIVMLLIFSVWRVLAQQKFIETLPQRRVILYGDPARVAKLEEYIKTDPARRFILSDVPHPGNKEALIGAINGGEADCAIITDNIRGARSLAFEVFMLRPDAAVYLVPAIYDIIVGALHHTVLGDMPLICLSQKTIITRLLLLKRLIDCTLSIVALVIASPFIVISVAATVLTSRGPAFYSQERVGRGGRLFRIYKIRTMVVDAEKHSGPMLSSEDDPRVTAVGRLLRKFKIDELPQLLNVLFGQMSLVGPRPERPEFVEEFEKQYPAYADRKKVLPGITGLAQISGLYESDPDMKLKYDLLYIYNYRPLMDIAIMYRTIQYFLRENFLKRRKN